MSPSISQLVGYLAFPGWTPRFWVENPSIFLWKKSPQEIPTGGNGRLVQFSEVFWSFPKERVFLGICPKCIAPSGCLAPKIVLHLRRIDEVSSELVEDDVTSFLLPETNSSPLKIDPLKRRSLLETTIFRGYVSFRECSFLRKTAIIPSCWIPFWLKTRMNASNV